MLRRPVTFKNSGVLAKKPHVCHELDKESLKLNIWWGVTHYKAYGLLFFDEETIFWGFVWMIHLHTGHLRC
jgi:hypothetical protein